MLSDIINIITIFLVRAKILLRNYSIQAMLNDIEQPFDYLFLKVKKKMIVFYIFFFKTKII